MLVIVIVTLPALALSVFLSYDSDPLGLAAIARLPDAPPAAGAALEVAELVPVPVAAAEEVAAEEVAAEEVAPAAEELELELPPQAAIPTASAAALISRAGSLNMAVISFFGVSGAVRGVR